MVKLVTIQFLNSCMNLLLRIIIYIIHMMGKIRREDSGIQMLQNATIKWEDVAQWNIGVDASFLDNRFEYDNRVL